MNRRAGVVAGLCLTLTMAVLAGCSVPGHSSCHVPDKGVSASAVRVPLQGDPSDPRLARLVKAASSWGLGTVIGSVGYDYDQFVTLAGLPDGLGLWVKDSPVFGVLDDSLKPRWGIRVSKDPHTYDYSADRFVQVALPSASAPEVRSWDMRSGHLDWCRPLDQPGLHKDDPVATSVLPEGDVLVLAGHKGMRLTSVASRSGEVRWTRGVSGVDRGDYLSAPEGGVVVAGGRPLYDLADAPGDPVSVSGIRVRTGETVWRHSAPGRTVSVIGDSSGDAVLLERSASGAELVSLTVATGTVRWHRTLPPQASYDVALRGGVVLQRTKTSLRGFDAMSGKPLWIKEIPTTRQFFPYGFTLSGQPMLDERHLLLAGTEALHELDVRTGAVREHALPIDGISTTFWPYALVATTNVLAVATNTGAVVLRR